MDAGGDAYVAVPGRHVAVDDGSAADADRALRAEATEHLGLRADLDVRRTDVAVQPAVVADGRRRRDPPGVVGDARTTRDPRGLRRLRVVRERRRRDLLGGFLLADTEQMRQIHEQEDDRRHRVSDDDPAVRLEPLVDVDVVADVQIPRDDELAGDVDAFTEVGVVTDEHIAVDLTPHVESAVAVGFDVTAEANALAGHHAAAADAEFDGALSTDEDVTVGDEVVFLYVSPVRDHEFLEGIRTEHGCFVFGVRINPSGVV